MTGEITQPYAVTFFRVKTMNFRLLKNSESFIYIIIIVLTVFLNIRTEQAGPDSNLYLQLAKNILNLDGYIDNIRNDEIMPPVGHPILIGIGLAFGIDGEIYTKTIISVSFWLFYISLKNLKLSIFFPPLFIAFISIFPSFIIWGIESSILFTCAFLLFALTLYYKTRSNVGLILLTVGIVSNIIVRPLILPLVLAFILTSVLFAIYQKRNNPDERVANFFPLAVSVAASILVISGASFTKYNDNRFISGTYSAIPLYCAWNPFINLEQTYTSTVWESLDPSVKHEALAPLVNQNGWKKRDKILKEKSLEFIKNMPSKAASGYWFRVQKYLFWSDSSAYNSLILLWGGFMIAVFCRYKSMTATLKYISVFSTLAPIYVVLVNSFFIYAEYRYTLTPLLAFFGSLTAYLYLLRDKIYKSFGLYYKH